MMKNFVLLTCLLCTTFKMAYANPSTTNPCNDDIKKHCLHSKQDKNAMAKCLYQHQEDLSHDCKEKMDRARKKVGQIRHKLKEQCGEDIKKHCPNLEGRDLKRCTKVKVKEFSEDCQKFLKKVPQKSTKKGPKII